MNPRWLSTLSALILLAGVSAEASRVPTRLTTIRNDPASVLIEEPWAGTYLNEGAAKTTVRLINRQQGAVGAAVVFVKFPGESSWRQSLTLEPDSGSRLTGLPPGDYQFAAMRNRYLTPGFEHPSFWYWGPVSLKVKKGTTSRWTLK